MVTSHEEGFTLVEAVMASFVVIVLFAGFGRTMGAAYQGSAENSAALEATAIAVEQLEFVRSLEWNQVALTYVDESAPMVHDETKLLDGEAARLPEDEALIVNQHDGLVSPVAAQIVDDTSYVVYSYITDAGDGLRRVVLLIKWELEGVVETYRTATLISEVTTR